VRQSSPSLFRFSAGLAAVGGIILAILAGAAPALHADLVLVQKMSGDMQNGTVTLKFKGHSVRTDFAGQVSSIADAGSGEVLTLLHARRVFVRGRLDSDRLRSNLPAAEPASGGDLKPVVTGTKETLGEHECEIYTASHGKISAKYWVAVRHPMADKVRGALEPVSAAGALLAGGVGLPSPKDFPGLVLKTELQFEKIKAVLEFVSASEEPIPAQLFQVPKEYREEAAVPNP
jgi:hypothetical protein